mgnify:CR=1 FL=1
MREESKKEWKRKVRGKDSVSAPTLSPDTIHNKRFKKTKKGIYFHSSFAYTHVYICICICICMSVKLVLLLAKEERREKEVSFSASLIRRMKNKIKKNRA